jgi:hypothetical protein
MTTFYDFGAGKGNSMLRSARIWGGEGRGIERNARRCAEAVARGLCVDCRNMFDAMPEIPPKSVDYVTICHVLEHLPTLAMIRETVAHAVRVAMGFVYIEGPWCESDGMLLRHGIKQRWNDKPDDHPYPVNALTIFSALLAAGAVRRVTFWGRGPVLSADHPDFRAIHDGDERKLAVPEITLAPGECFEEICCVAELAADSDAAARWESGQASGEIRKIMEWAR